MTPHPEAPPAAVRRSRSPYVVMAWIVAIIGLPAAVGIWLVAGPAGDQPPPKTIEVVVPEGTQERLDAGEKVSIMPTRLEFRVGDTFLIRNEDTTTQVVGPYTVGAGEELRFTYGAPGDYSGFCPLSEGERYEIVVRK